MVFLIYISTGIAVLMALGVLFVRMKASKKPVSTKKIVLPPIFMSTGALMFLHPFFRVTFLNVLEAFFLGVFFSIFLILTSKFEIKDNEIYLKRSKAFAFILIALLVIRLVGKLVLTSTIDFGELSGMFWILAFGMIVPWRIAMYFQYKQWKKKLDAAVLETVVEKAP